MGVSPCMPTSLEIIHPSCMLWAWPHLGMHLGKLQGKQVSVKQL